MDLRDRVGEEASSPNRGAGEGVGVGDGVAHGELQEEEGHPVKGMGMSREGVRQRGDLLGLKLPVVTRDTPAGSRGGGGGDGEKVGVTFPEEQDGGGGGVLLSCCARE